MIYKCELDYLWEPGSADIFHRFSMPPKRKAAQGVKRATAAASKRRKDTPNTVAVNDNPQNLQQAILEAILEKLGDMEDRLQALERWKNVPAVPANEVIHEAPSVQAAFEQAA